MVKKAIREALRASDRVDPNEADAAEQRESHKLDYDRGEITNILLLREPPNALRDVKSADDSLCGEGNDHHTEYAVD